MIRRYTVFGNPIEHSLSPRIHTLFSEQVQRKIEYTKTRVETGQLENAIKEFQRSGASGCNVTVPFKEDAYALCDTLSENAQRAGAVNTIKFTSNGSIEGFNTDGSGLVTDIIDNLGAIISDSRIVIAGAGGAARGILLPLLEQQPRSITICNRTLEKAQALVDRFAQFTNLAAKSYEDIDDVAADIVINATSLGLQGSIPRLPPAIVASNTLVYDLMYAKEATDFVKWGESCNAARATDGLGMLLEQAADAFFIWEGIRPDTRLILPKLPE